jgi:hypothetical protein
VLPDVSKLSQFGKGMSKIWDFFGVMGLVFDDG